VWEIAAVCAALSGERPGESVLRNALSRAIAQGLPGLERAAREGLTALERDDAQHAALALFEVGVLTGFLIDHHEACQLLREMAQRRAAKHRKAPADFMARWTATYDGLPAGQRQKLLADQALADQFNMSRGYVTNLRNRLEKDSTHPG
jgi:hypothetical protein